MEMIKERATQALSLVVLIAAWEVLSYVLDSPALPPATEVGGRLWDLLAAGDAFGPLWSTVLSTALGFILGFLTGLAYGITVYLRPGIGAATAGLLNIALFAPTLILIFLGLIMLGHDSRVTVVLIAGLVIFPNMAVYFRDTLRDLDGDTKEMVTSFKAGLWQRVRDVYMPYLIPPMLAAGRVGFSLAWKVAFLTEAFGFPEGLGWQVRNSYRVYDMTLLLAWLAVFIIALLLVEQLTRVVERAVVKW